MTIRLLLWNLELFDMYATTEVTRGHLASKLAGLDSDIVPKRLGILV